MAKCLRCGAGNEWIQGRAAPEEELRERVEAIAKNLECEPEHAEIVALAVKASNKILNHDYCELVAIIRGCKPSDVTDDMMHDDTVKRLEAALA